MHCDWDYNEGLIKSEFCHNWRTINSLVRLGSWHRFKFFTDNMGLLIKPFDKSVQKQFLSLKEAKKLYSPELQHFPTNTKSSSEYC